MKRIAVYGKTTREKNFLMLYLSKVLSVEHKVVLLSERDLLLNEVDCVDYNDNFVINKHIEDKESTCDFKLIDLTGVFEEDKTQAFDITYFVTSPYREDIEANEAIIKGLEMPYTVIFQNLIYDLKISTKYLSKRLKITKKTHKIYEQYLNDNDLGIHIENEYDGQIVMRHLSKDYKELLLQLILDIDLGFKKPSKKWLKKAMRKA